ncbi:hypothetical protein IQ266_07770 [filamentous cyanobacterium LEGE 11480]|uniref:Uncharacterized protein n=1 Tax=Romeriopsis navalis LEGE 11480 TaxID=2777977 RepID=A0A928VJS2_9CYAN|nr:hypothetical protein [Romeriopsis navalis]MBE9029625.1 hypothetical protein [Romeriopsis navalis LEGE 11480]
MLMMPVRFVQAIYYFLDFFTRRYMGKLLMSASAQKLDVPMHILRAWGELVTPEMLHKGNWVVDVEAPALVPDT